MHVYIYINIKKILSLKGNILKESEENARSWSMTSMHTLLTWQWAASLRAGGREGERFS